MPTTLTELQRIPTSGARAATTFLLDGQSFLAIPQLAVDAASSPAGMNGGDSGTCLQLLRRVAGRYEPWGELAAPGGEDAEFFTIGDRSFLAVASIRTGAGPYDYATSSVVHEWRDGAWQPFQAVPTYAAKQWRHWRVDGRDFLGLAQGIDLPHLPGPNRPSTVLEWDGSRFEPCQEIASTWGYNWHAFQAGGHFWVAHADHVGPSVLHRWDGTRLVEHQSLLPERGRAFADFSRDGEHYLLVAGIESPPVLLRWDGTAFAPGQELAGLGARELAVVETGGRLFVVRVNFILGTPKDPDTSLRSQVYEWDGGALREVLDFPTSGGTDVALVAGAEGVELVVSNALSADVRFATDTVVYRLSPGEGS